MKTRFLIPYLTATTGSLALFYLFTVGALWQVYALSGSATWVGLFSLVQFLPALALFPWTGPFADRFSKRSLLQVTSLVASAVAVALWAAAPHGLGLPLLFLGAALISAVRSFEATALAAWLPEGVESAELSRAVALSSFFKQGAKVGAPALSGALLVWSPDGSALYGSMALCGALTLGALALAPHGTPCAHPTSRGSVWEGIRYLKGQSVLQGAVLLDLVAGLFGGFTALLPVFAVEVLHTDAAGAGLLRSSLAVGALLGAGALARWPLRQDLGRHLLGSVAALGAVTLALAHSTHFALALALVAAFGALDSLSINIRQTLIQLATPRALRGRVTATGQLAILVSNQLGEFRAGVMGGLLGVYPAVALGGLCTLGAAAVWGRLFPGLAALTSFDEVQAAAEAYGTTTMDELTLDPSTVSRA